MASFGVDLLYKYIYKNRYIFCKSIFRPNGEEQLQKCNGICRLVLPVQHSNQLIICNIDNFWSSQKKQIHGKLLKVVKFQNLVGKCCNMWKYSLRKFANFLYYCISYSCGNCHKMVTISTRIFQAIFLVFYNISRPNFWILLFLKILFLSGFAWIKNQSMMQIVQQGLVISTMFRHFSKT